MLCKFGFVKKPNLWCFGGEQRLLSIPARYPFNEISPCGEMNRQTQKLSTGPQIFCEVFDSSFGFSGGKATLKGWRAGLDKSLFPIPCVSDGERIATAGRGLPRNDKLSASLPREKSKAQATIFCGEEERWSVREGISHGYGCEQSGIRDDEAGGYR